MQDQKRRRKEEEMKTIMMADPVRYPRMTTGELRETFLIQDLYEAGSIHLTYVDLDRAVIGMAAPLGDPLTLPAGARTPRKLFHGTARGRGPQYWGCRRDSRGGIIL